MNKNVLFDIKGMVCSYEGSVEKPVLRIDNLQIMKGQVVFFVGPSGIGKSTILETLGMMNNTVVKAEKFLYLEKDLSVAWTWPDKKMSDFRNAEFSFIFQQNNLMPNFTAHENIITAALFQGENRESAQKRTLDVLNQLDLPSDDRPICEYSGGQLQRIAFARAVLPSYTVLFGDEPTGNLDSRSAHKLMSFMIESTKREQASAIMVSHDMALATQYADRIVQIQKVANPYCKGKYMGLIDDNSFFEKKNNTWKHLEEYYTEIELSNKLLNEL